MKNDVTDVMNDFRPNDPQAALRFFKMKMGFTTGPVELHSARSHGADICLIDVREPQDFAAHHIPGAVNLPKSEWHTLRGLDRGKLNVIYCYSQVCHLAARAAVFFANEGFPVMEMEGGFKEWRVHQLPIRSENREAAA